MEPDRYTDTALSPPMRKSYTSLDFLLEDWFEVASRARTLEILGPRVERLIAMVQAFRDHFRRPRVE